MEAKELAELLMQTGHHHHEAYKVSDGADPDWALWYAGYLQSKIWDKLGAVPSRSQLVYLLLSAEQHHLNTAKDKEWPPVYAEYILEKLGS